MNNQITKSIIVNGDVEHLYNTWMDFRNHPQFMENIANVTREREDINRWVMDGPLDTKLEWTTKTTRTEPNKRIAWKTVDGDLKTSGQVTFTDLPKGQTEITVTAQTVPPEDLAEKVAYALFANEEAQLEKDLRSFKAFIEKGSA